MAIWEPQTISPTHTCFDDALDLISALLRARQITWNNERWLIVHALIKPANCRIFAHAWIERDERIAVFSGTWDGQLAYFEASLAEYYAEFNPVRLTKYTVLEALAMNVRHWNFGPWEQCYRDACGPREDMPRGTEDAR
jgi:hypothetical protein